MIIKDYDFDQSLLMENSQLYNITSQIKMLMDSFVYEMKEITNLCNFNDQEKRDFDKSKIDMNTLNTLNFKQPITSFYEFVSLYHSVPEYTKIIENSLKSLEDKMDHIYNNKDFILLNQPRNNEVTNKVNKKLFNQKKCKCNKTSCSNLTNLQEISVGRCKF